MYDTKTKMFFPETSLFVNAIFDKPLQEVSADINYESKRKLFEERIRWNLKSIITNNILIAGKPLLRQK